jgi:hypothetical protein
MGGEGKTLEADWTYVGRKPGTKIKSGSAGQTEEGADRPFKKDSSSKKIVGSLPTSADLNEKLFVALTKAFRQSIFRCDFFLSAPCSFDYVTNEICRLKRQNLDWFKNPDSFEAVVPI